MNLKMISEEHDILQDCFFFINLLNKNLNRECETFTTGKMSINEHYLFRLWFIKDLHFLPSPIKLGKNRKTQ